jgi:ABC-2 type transport system ATP-binding protein
MPALAVTGLRKRYGSTVALDGLDLTVPEGVISGFIGPNGAGKTTTFGIIGGLIRADEGAVSILDGGPVRPGSHPGLLTMLPQDCELVPHVSVLVYLRYLARLQGMTAAEATRSAEARLEEMALADRASSRIRELSHGMRRRVAIAQALLGEPRLVLLDEPTSGLDPELVVRMREVFAAQRGRRTLVISSHNLRELEAVCDHVAFVQRGRCVRSGSLEEITQRGLLMRYRVENTFDLSALAQKLGALSFQGEGHELIVTAPDGWSAAKINAAVVPHLLEAGLLEIRQGQSLEDAYLQDHH